MIKLDDYDIIIIGAGHAGCEAALAAARMGSKTLMLTMSLESVAQMSCNPAIGGLAKGHIVKEIDALGGEMGKVIDQTGIQFRMLNKGKGPAVWAPRAQADKKAYQWTMKNVLESQENLDVKMAEVKDLILDGPKVIGVTTSIGTSYGAKAIIITTGTFLNGKIHIGDFSFGGGRAGEKPSAGLSAHLMNVGLNVLRLKTGTPCRLNARSINYSALKEQPGDENPQPFSFSTQDFNPQQIPCHLTFTNKKTHEIIKDNLSRSPLYSGKIKSKGPRYCPSIEDKVVRFAEKSQHQIFIEPEGRQTQEVYVNGISTSLPQDVQISMIRSIEGLEKAELMRFGYAVEYDFVEPTQLNATLETKKVEGLYLAGQINGTSGYEEAAGQGLMAGINAVLKIQGNAPFVLGRNEAYIGVLIDDLVTKGTIEPYRMFTSRAEYRLVLRQDNAETRLMAYGKKLGLVNENLYERFIKEESDMKTFLGIVHKAKHGEMTLHHYMKTPEADCMDLYEALKDKGITQRVATKLAIEIKYAGYIERELKAIGRMKHLENKRIPGGMDYESINAISKESREKLQRIKPTSIGQASRISGMRPGDISVLTVHVSRLDRS